MWLEQAIEDQTHMEQQVTHSESRPVFIPLLLFIGSGCSALIYEVVWFQLLELVIGSSSVSMGVLLGTFMGGMCLGSVLLPKFISREYHPLRVYALMEVGIALMGLAVLYGMPWIGSIYGALAGITGPGMLLRATVAAVCLLPPAMLMGATLPAVARWVEATPRGVAWLGFFYGGNIGGAVVGSLLAGFYLLREYDTVVATFVAVMINTVVALLSLRIAAMKPYSPVAIAEQQDAAKPQTAVWATYSVIAISGMTALAAQVIWSRLLSLLFGATAYTFSLVVAVFLIGLGIGSGAGSAIGRSTTRPRAVLGWCQFLLCGAMVWTAYILMESLPFWPIDVRLAAEPWVSLQLDFIRCLWAVLPPAILWGASFPLALAVIASRGQDAGRVVARVYAANTAGAIVGSLGASLVLVTWAGTQHTLQLLVALSALSTLLAWGPSHRNAGPPATRMRIAGTILLVIGAGMLAFRVPALPNELVAYGRFFPTRNGGRADVFYMGEGLTASVAVSRLPEGILSYHNAGKVQASSDPADMRLQRMLGHLTTLVPEHRRTFLVIGCGAGVTAGAVSIEPKAEQITIAEIEPLVPEVASTYFGEQNFGVLKSPKVRLEIDDGRHFLLTTDQKFDGITSDPLDPWVKGAAMLYTKEFFELVQAHLNPGGVVTLFVQLYETTEEAVQSEIATFFDVFPNGAVFANNV
jgi:spermidine synthase